MVLHKVQVNNAAIVQLNNNTNTALANLQNDVNAIAGNLNQFQKRVATMYQDVEKSKNVDKEDLRKKTVAVNDLTNRVYKATETKDPRKQENPENSISS